MIRTASNPFERHVAQADTSAHDTSPRERAPRRPLEKVLRACPLCSTGKVSRSSCVRCNGAGSFYQLASR